MVFGCSGNIMLTDLAGTSGFVGFSRGPLSLVSQLNISRFSYFIAPPDNPVGSFVSWSWEDAATAPDEGSARCHSTPLLVATANQYPYLYYVELTGVLVDGQLLNIPAGTFDVQADGSGGVYLSTTLPVTYLNQAAYNVIRQTLMSMMQSQGVIPINAAGDPNHLCFLTQYIANAKVPKLGLVFAGADAAMELKAVNYFFAYGGQTASAYCRRPAGQSWAACCRRAGT